MQLGYHVSIAKGLVEAVRQGLRTGCECAQTFSRNPRGWAAKVLNEEDAARFREAWSASGLSCLTIHLPYLPNLASADPELRGKSIRVLAEEFHRGRLLDASYIVTHPGLHKPHEDLVDARRRIAEAAVEAIGLDRGDSPQLLLETTSGRRGEVGATFEDLADIIVQIEERVSPVHAIGVCLDTAHIWAAGYDLSSAKSQDAVLTDFDRIIGLQRLKLIHFNDSLSELGGRKDRHAAVGKGKIGHRAMARLVRHPAFENLCGIMETPFVSEADDLINMNRAKGWRRRKQTGREIPRPKGDAPDAVGLNYL